MSYGCLTTTPSGAKHLYLCKNPSCSEDQHFLALFSEQLSSWWYNNHTVKSFEGFYFIELISWNWVRFLALVNKNTLNMFLMNCSSIINQYAKCLIWYKKPYLTQMILRYGGCDRSLACFCNRHNSSSISHLRWEQWGEHESRGLLGSRVYWIPVCPSI